MGGVRFSSLSPISVIFIMSKKKIHTDP
jgi:hypothetical protein